VGFVRELQINLDGFGSGICSAIPPQTIFQKIRREFASDRVMGKREEEETD
jgi:hypothetical protein